MLLIKGDCLEALKDLQDHSVDSMITDPPAGISFMGKSWDKGEGFIPFMTSVMKEALRVLKPGAHGLVWAIPRTSHWTATALENAGFEIRDVITHLFGTGFPKSLNVGKQTNRTEHQGIGTALKPASEHWILIRKPCSEKTVAANVLKHGTGGINIDASRIQLIGEKNPSIARYNSTIQKGSNGWEHSNRGANFDDRTEASMNLGRFPANLILDEEAAKLLDEQSGNLTSGKPTGNKNRGNGYHGNFGEIPVTGFGDSGGASRFFYCAKASKADKGKDNTHPTVKSTKLMSYLINLITPPQGVVLDPFMGSGSTGVAAIREGFKFIGIEKEDDYLQIAERRIENQ